MFVSENPCNQPLYKSDTNTFLCEIAHIIDASEDNNIRIQNTENLEKLREYVKNKNPHFLLKDENLIKSEYNGIALCCNCHQTIDSHNYTVEKLLSIKDKIIEYAKKLEVSLFNNYNEMSNVVIPILKENKEIVDLYGFENDPLTHQDKYPLWLKNESILLKNNRTLKTIFQKNIKLFAKCNNNIIDEFCKHVKEFEDTRDQPNKRYSLFPKEVMDLFNIEPVSGGKPYSNCDALINYCNNNKYKDILLITKPIPQLQYRDINGKSGFLELNNFHYLHQLLWNNYCIKPKKDTGVRLENLLYHLNLLEQNGIYYQFDILNMILIFKKNIVKLVYEYCFTSNNYYEIRNKNDFKIICNLHNFNDAPNTCKNMQHEYWNSKQLIWKIHNE